MSTLHSSRFAVLALIAVGLAGCSSAPLAPGPTNSVTGQAKGAKFTGPSSDAGVKADQANDPKVYPQMVAMATPRLSHRGDPFALTSTEKSFDLSQQAERVFTQIGGFDNYAQPEEEVAPPVQVEPQPYRRLSGVVVGDSVLAIADMGNGQSAVLIRPGMHIEGTDWTVVSIDQDKAILRRSGNVLPKEIEVRLETPPPGYGPANNPGMGAPGMGAPGGGGFPGGFPGGGRFRGGGGGQPGGGGASGD